MNGLEVVAPIQAVNSEREKGGGRKGVKHHVPFSFLLLCPSYLRGLCARLHHKSISISNSI